jgi:hypothetical protein
VKSLGVILPDPDVEADVELKLLIISVDESVPVSV